MTWRRSAAALALAAALPVMPSAAADDVTFETGFETGAEVFPGGWGMEHYPAGHVGAGLRSVIPAGGHWGSSGHWAFAANGLSEPDQLWWRYWVRFDEDFYIEPPNRGKLPGIGGLYTYNCLGGRPSTPEEPCFSARMLFSRTYPRFGSPGYPNGPDDKTLIGFYVYHLDSPATRGDIWTWDPEVATLDHGPWYCVEGHIEMNTPGLRDGVLEGWVDGAAAFSRDDIGFRRADEAWLHIKSFWFDVYHGGEAAAVRNEIYFDSLAFGPSRIGCIDYTPPFWDDDGSVFADDIAWLYASGITAGCNPPRNNAFCPGRPVSRGQMAAFLERALALPASTGDAFGDDDDSIFEESINALAAAGITRGCNPPANDQFCPDRTLSRGEMAAFLVRAFELGAGSGNPFVDDDGSVFENAIEALAAAGVTVGCNPPANDHFCPSSGVTRGQMAAFLHRAMEGG